MENFPKSRAARAEAETVQATANIAKAEEAAKAEELRLKIIRSDGKWRFIFAGIAIVVPLLFFGLFRRQEMRLRALAEHGRTGTATLTYVRKIGEDRFAHYQYEVGGVTYSWNVAQAEAPFEPGQSFEITYLPEDPEVSRPGAGYSVERLEGELNLPVQRRALLGIFGFFSIVAVWAHVRVVQLKKGAPIRTKPPVSPAWAGRIVALLLLGVMIGVNFDPKVRAVQAAVFGERPLGLPITAVVSIAEVVLAAPFFVVFEHLMTIVMEARARGESISKLGIVLAVLRAGPERRRSQVIIVGGLVYCFVLVGAWIALAASRGV